MTIKIGNISLYSADFMLNIANIDLESNDE